MSGLGRNRTRPPTSRPGNGRTRRPRTTTRSPLLADCGSCDNVECIFTAVEVCFILGIVTNLIVVVTVARKPVLRTPTFVTIACLALADALFLSFNIMSVLERLIKILSCTVTSEITGLLVVKTLNGITWFAASSHVTFISVVRFIMVAYPLKFHIWLRTRRLLIVSAALWLIGGAVFGIVALLTKTDKLGPKSSLQTKFGVWITVYLMPLVVTSLLHVIKLRKMKRRANVFPNTRIRNSVNRMSKIILTVIILAVILPAPRLIYLVLDEFDVKCSTRTCRSALRNIFFILFILNSSINPVIYAFMSPVFRRHLIPKCLNKVWSRSFSALSTFRSSRTLSSNLNDSKKESAPYTVSSV